MKKTLLTIEVLETTEKALKNTAEAMEMSVGAVIDRMALNWETKDPIYAAQLVLEEMAINFHRLSPEGINSALILIFDVIKRCIDNPTPENIRKATEEFFSNEEIVEDLE